MSKTGLTRRERQIMDILYQMGQATAQEVLDRLDEPPSYSAVRALLRLLEERGHVVHSRDGQRYVYRATVSKHEARSGALAHVVHTFFDGSVEQAVTALVESSHEKLTEEELRRLSELIEKAKQEGR